jgi:hypothetical protein
MDWRGLIWIGRDFDLLGIEPPQSIWIRVEPNKPLGGIELNYCSIEAISMLYYVYFILRKDSNRTP